MDEKLKEIGQGLDVSEEDIRIIRTRRNKDIIILSIVGAITSFLSFCIGFGIGNTEKYGMAYYPYAVVPLVALKGDKARYAIWGIGGVIFALLGIFTYLQGFEAGKVFFSCSIDYGVFGRGKNGI